MALYKMMKGDEPQGLNSKGQTTEDGTENELRTMMRDPKYWRDRDPAFIQKVTDGFQKIYGNQA